MRRALFALLCFPVFSLDLNAERLSFTDRNKDELCGEGPYCSEVKIIADETRPLDRGGYLQSRRLFILRTVITLYPNIASGEDAASVAKKTADAKTVDVDVVVETGDQVKHEFTKRSVPILIQKQGEITYRYCDVEFGIPEFEIVAVHAIDVSEERSQGQRYLSAQIQVDAAALIARTPAMPGGNRKSP